MIVVALYRGCEAPRDICGELLEALGAEASGGALCINVNAYSLPWQSHVAAIISAAKAIAKGRNVARKPEVEYIVRLFGERQISTVLGELAPRLSGDTALLALRLRSNGNPHVAELVAERLLERGCRLVDPQEAPPEESLRRAASVLPALKGLCAGADPQDALQILVAVPGSSELLLGS